MCGLPEQFKEKLPIGDEPLEVKARGSKDSRPPPEPKRRREETEIGWKLPTADGLENYERKCPVCANWQSATLHLCMNCMEPLSQAWKGEVETILQQLMSALLITKSWTDRGPRSKAGDERRRLLHYARRAFNLGYGTCSARFEKDAAWRDEMKSQGWDSDTIGIIDSTADAPAPNAADAGRRTKEQRGKTATYFHKYEGAARQLQVPQGILDRPADVRVTNARRREATAQWKEWASWNANEEWSDQDWWYNRRWSDAWHDAQWR